MNKKIAVVVTDRQEEALRMSIGLTLADDEVDVYFMDQKLTHTGDNDLNIETGKELGVGLYSTCEETDDLILISQEELAGKLLNYDHILPY
ncbi:hypothetical protein [Kaarinaea lacus]